MDPTSMTASIVAILQLTTTLTGYINDVKKATKEQARIAVEASNLYGLLTSLRYRVEEARSDEPWYNQVKLLAMKDGPLDQFKDTLEKMVERIPTSRKRDQVKSILTWTLTKTEVDNALARMERLKSLISCALNNDLFVLEQEIHGKIVSISDQVQQIDLRSQRLQSHIDNELQQRLSKWLGLPDPSSNYHSALKKRHPETGTWFIDGLPFQNWKRSMSSAMWIHGSVGCGKTVLSAAALQNLYEYQGIVDEVVIIYFYFDFNDAEKRSASKALRSLLFQFAQQTEHAKALEQLYRKCEDGQRQPAEDAVQALLTQALSRPQPTFILLDAVDECMERDEFLRFLQNVIQAAPPRLHIMAISRREKDIEDCLGQIARHVINIESLDVDQDIRRYVQGSLATDPKLKKWAQPIQDEILRSLMEKAGGMFRWVVCQLDSIRQCVKLSALRKALASLPKTLDETYERILQTLESQGQLEDAIKVLQWLCFSYAPMTRSQLIDVLATENGDDGGFSPEERLPDPADMMVVCSSLISFDPIDQEQYGSPDDSYPEVDLDVQVRLAHFSVQEYLLSERCAFRSSFRNETCHSVIAEGCLHYILDVTSEAPLTNEIELQHPLLDYAANNWDQHVRKAGESLAGAVVELAVNVFTGEGHALVSWLRLCGKHVLLPRNPDRERPTEDTIGLSIYYAASTGLCDVVESVLQGGADVNARKGGHGSALYVASSLGFEKVVRVLLDAGADVNILKDSIKMLPLHIASNRGHTGVVKMLLEAGANVNLRGLGMCDTALQEASMNGHPAVVRLLIDAGADVNASRTRPARHDELPLHLASWRGYAAVVQMLLTAGADVNAKDEQGQIALHLASSENEEQVLQILLDAGADVDAISTDENTALHLASNNGSETIVRQLLEAGADVSKRREKGGTALQQASCHGHERVVQMLLDAGVDVDATCDYGSTALHWASGNSHTRVVRILLDAGADLNTASYDEDVIQELLDAGADMNASARDGLSTLQWPSGSTYERVVQTLLNGGADLRTILNDGGTPLQWASTNGHEEVVQMLLEAGADVNAGSEEGLSALQWASASGHERVVQMLLDAGADEKRLHHNEHD